MCFCTTILSAQTSFYASDTSYLSADVAIVRSWDDGSAAITYYEVGSERYMQYVNYVSGNSLRVEVPYNLRILDMYILGDHVYYCGYSLIDVGGNGVVGYFKPSDFYTSTYVDFYTLPVRPLTRVEKIVAQENVSIGGVEVIGIGEHQWYDTIHDLSGTHLVPHLNRHLLFCHDIMQNPATYDTMLVYPDEHYYNVLLTDNYVVFVGAISGPPISICMRLRERTNPVLMGTLSDIHIFSTGTDEVFSAMHSTSMEGDSIATAYMHIDPTTHDISNRIRVFDVDAKIMVNSQDYYVPDKSEVTDIVYIAADKSLVCMQDFVTPSNANNTNFVYIKPSASVDYVTNMEYLKGIFFKSMTNSNDKHYLASDGLSWFMKDKINVGSYLNPICPITENYKCYVIRNWQVYRTPYPPTHDSARDNVDLDPKQIDLRVVRIICKNS